MSTLVGHDAAHLGGGQEYVFRSFSLKERFDISLSREVQFLVSAQEQVVVALSLKFAHDGRAHHTPVAGNINFCVFLHGIFLICVILRYTCAVFLSEQ